MERKQNLYGLGLSTVTLRKEERGGGCMFNQRQLRGRKTEVRSADAVPWGDQREPPLLLPEKRCSLYQGSGWQGPSSPFSRFSHTGQGNGGAYPSLHETLGRGS